MMSARVPAVAAGAATSSTSTMTRSALAMAWPTLAAPFRPPGRAGGGQRAAHPVRPEGVGMARGDRVAARRAQPQAERGVVVQPPDRCREGRRVAGGNDESRLLMANEAGGGGSDGGCRDHGHALVEGLVDDEPPRLQEGGRGDRRYDHDVRARVEVAD